MIAALFVQTGGAYFGLPDVEPWDEARDARLYAGPHPVVAHPPCARWCQLAGLVEARYPYLKKGEDGGCFASALASVRKWGGVLEHPAFTSAWPAYDLTEPRADGWIRTFDGGWVCEVSQRPFGHRARKLTWLYYVGSSPPRHSIGVGRRRWRAPLGARITVRARSRSWASVSGPLRRMPFGICC